jgi:hypothetical protein
MTRKAHECELAARLTGKNFNVFKILDLRTAEVRTHSAFIAELLNPQGSHGQGATYLRLFLDHLQVRPEAFSPDRAKAKVEYCIGPVVLEDGKERGGRIDILLTDESNRHILIENKIWAGDGEKQLLRYHRFDEKAVLLYLTLGGREPEKTSTGGHYCHHRCLSYQTNIRDWLEECHKASVSLPVVRESIVQYKHLICELTNQATGDKVKDEAKNLILDHPELADAVALLGEAWQGILQKVKADFDELTKDSNTWFHGDGGVVKIRRSMPSDCGGVVVAFHIEGATKADAQRYAVVLQSIVEAGMVAAENGNYNKSNYWNIGWYWPKGFKTGGGIESLPKEQVIKFHKDRADLVAFASDISKRAEAVTEELLAKMKATV